MLIDSEEELNLPLRGSVAGQVLVENRSIVVEDTAALSKTFFLHLQNGQLPRALIVVPIRQGDKITGVLEGYSDKPRRFSLEEIALLETFTVQAALALEKAQLYRHKEDFLSMTAHDLRAPLTAIKMSSGLLESTLPDSLPPAIGRLVSNINRNSIRLDNLIRDLLDLTRLEQGQIQLNLEQLDIRDVLDNALVALTPLFDEKQQMLQRQETSVPYWVSADRHRLEQALVNLLVNANKYTPDKGQITVSLHEDPAVNKVSILIQDSGPGIPAKEQPRIFDRYYRQALHEQMPQVAGSGLGLPISRWLVELHGGQLRVESDPGVRPGSCFIIDLPLLNLV
jgi:signal transduction histidine kinase